MTETIFKDNSFNAPKTDRTVAIYVQYGIEYNDPNYWLSVKSNKPHGYREIKCAPCDVNEQIRLHTGDMWDSIFVIGLREAPFTQ